MHKYIKKHPTTLLGDNATFKMLNPPEKIRTMVANW